MKNRSSNRRLDYIIGVSLDIGMKRRDRLNQDAVGLALPGVLQRKPPLFILADGMGGYAGGAIASQAVIQATKKYYRSNKNTDFQELLKSAIHYAHKEITNIAGKRAEYSRMGSTIAAGIINDNHLYFGNVGDSRIYIVNPEKIRQVSLDQSVVGGQLRGGIITEFEARNHPKRNQLSMSISAKRETIKPYIGKCQLDVNDVVVFCSDGAWGAVTDAQIQAIVLELPPQEAAEKIVAMANANLGPDNISVIVVRHKEFSYTPEES